MNIGRIIGKLALPLSVGAFGVLFLLERRRPLRNPVESKGTRAVRNLAVAGTAAAAGYLIERPAANRAATLVEKRNVGLLKLVRLPKWFEQLAAVVLLDYTLYLWHYLTHRVPALWRFHVVHHADLDLDSTTALRFHFGEIAISVAWRAAQIVVIGVSPASLRMWYALLLPSVIFHHSNVEMPERLERKLNAVFVTPRMHGIHHSVVKEEADSNWSSGLSIWDRIHGTFRDISNHEGVDIGVPAYRSPDEITVGKLIVMPFEEQRPTWKLPAGEDIDGH
jgi:sterol desaturase/sphingolipid hydroxylase (fatty acid hydroxylase superfamily)